MRQYAPAALVGVVTAALIGAVSLAGRPSDHVDGGVTPAGAEITTVESAPVMTASSAPKQPENTTEQLTTGEPDAPETTSGPGTTAPVVTTTERPTPVEPEPTPAPTPAPDTDDAYIPPSRRTPPPSPAPTTPLCWAYGPWGGRMAKVPCGGPWTEPVEP